MAAWCGKAGVAQQGSRVEVKALTLWRLSLGLDTPQAFPELALCGGELVERGGQVIYLLVQLLLHRGQLLGIEAAEVYW